MLFRAALLLLCWHHAMAFVPGGVASRGTLRTLPSKRMAMSEVDRPPFELEINLGKAGVANLRMKPTLPNSEAIVVQSKLPFGLNVEPREGRAMVTKDNPNPEGEKVGDILRYTTSWALGLPRGDGLLTNAAAFGGAIGWNIDLFDIDKAQNWDEAVKAITSNTPQRTDSVTLIFERPIKDEAVMDFRS